MYVVNLREMDNTMTPFYHANSLAKAVEWADKKGIDYIIDYIFFGGHEQIAEHVFGKRVVRRKKKS